MLYLRTILLLSLAALSGLVGVAGIFTSNVKAQPTVVQVNPFEYEHRVTALEVSVKAINEVQADIARQLTDLQTAKWLELVALSGLLGETGIRAFRGMFGAKE